MRRRPRASETWRRFAVRSLFALTPLTVVTAVIDAFLAVVVGRLTADPIGEHLVALAWLTAASLVVTWASVLTWRAVAAAGERRLRGELLHATLHQQVSPASPYQSYLPAQQLHSSPESATGTPPTLSDRRSEGHQ
ncbi:hypothetical protein L1785_13605 [Antribacter sp. KLBMP9083]|uniref:Uncharacterized protein n=1 Tax=Antribacter soli TaxID=2910976 RepID=A0AA41QEJ8_9MICO|nr:hypothetical protein [Antribacter soli]MCF4122014.1 hypothetical protein [Antribacter soli]